jgi:ribosomal protein S18 acetylase RimI-like enzyme
VIAIRPYRAGDLATVERMLLAAFPGSVPYGSRLAEFVASNRAWVAVAADDGAVAGMVTLLDYGTSSYVAHVGVEPGRQRSGIGRRMMEALLAEARARKHAYVELESTAAGFALYESLGFVVAGETATASGDPRPLDTSAGSMVAERRDLDGIVALDHEAFGCDRSATIAQWFDDPGVTIAIVRSGGAVAAYAMARNGRLGPWIARDADVAERAFDRAVAALGPGASAYLPLENDRAVAIAAARGLAVGRRHPHMLWGRADAVVRPLVYGRITLGQG